MWIKSALIAVWLVLSYTSLVFWATTWWQAIPLAVSLALAVAGVGFNIMHDGGHGAYSRHRLVNRLSALSLDLIGASSYVWHFKHNVMHHHYTNIEGVDEDIEAEPFLRLAPGQPRRPYHRFQHYYVWLLLGLFHPKWAFVDDFRTLIIGRIGSRAVPRPRGRELVILLTGKVAHLAFALLIPLALHPWTTVAIVYAVFSLILGITLATVFQLAHCVEEASFAEIPKDDQRMERDWVKHQLATTVDFAPRNRGLTWYLGGLNFQVEHHLFPRISHLHYPALAAITRAVCDEHGVAHRSHDTFWGALRSHVQYLKRMGQPRDLNEAR